MKNAKNINVQLVTVTPSLACEMLGTNPICDDLNEKKIQKYARKMKSGHWKLRPTAIVFDEDYALINGRHRLWAVFEAGIPVKFLVAFIN